ESYSSEGEGYDSWSGIGYCYGAEDKKIRNDGEKAAQLLPRSFSPEVKLFEGRKIAREKEIFSKVDAVLEPGNLVLDLIDGVYKEVLTKEKLEKKKNPTFETYQNFTEPSHEALIGYQRLAEMDISIRTELNDLGLEENYPLETREEEAVDLHVDMPETVDNVKVLTEKEKLDHACKLWLKKVTKFRETVGCNGNNGPKEESQYLNERVAEIGDGKSKKVRDEDRTIERLIRINEESTNGLVEFSSSRRELKRQPERKLTEINNMPNADGCYRHKIWESTDISDDKEEIVVRRHYQNTKEDNSASQFDPGEFCWQKSQLKKIRKEKLVGSNDNNNNRIKNSMKKRGSLVPSEDDEALDKINWEVLVRNNNENDEEKNHKKEKPLEESLHQKWNRRLQISYKKMNDLPKSNREINQNIKHAENGEIVTSKVGNVSERIDIIEAIDSEIVHHLFDPGGSICPNILCRPKES
ncbi:16662_t:CDS:2, partial [Gigaspora margarita]